MNPRSLHLLSGAVFTIITLGQLTRVLLGLRVSVQNLEAPLWVSVVAVVIAGTLAALNFAAFRARELTAGGTRDQDTG